MLKSLRSALMINLFGLSMLCAQTLTPEKLGFKAYSIQDKKLGQINYYVTSNQVDTLKPLLLYLDGSGPYPLFQYTKQGVGSTVVLNFRNLAKTYHLVIISKPSIPFADSVNNDPATGFPLYPAPPEYTRRLSLDWRVNSANLVLEKVLKDIPVARSKVAVLGFSEGFQVAAKLATINKRITHLLLFVGNGLIQFYDFIVHNRWDAQQGIISEEQAQKNIEGIYAAAKAIYANPDATDQEWFGHSYLRWSSFCQHNPTEELLKINIPIYMVGASRDHNSAVLSTDYLYLESLRQGKTNLLYKVYPYDHSFNEIVKDGTGQVSGMKNHLREVMDEGMDWLKKQ